MLDILVQSRRNKKAAKRFFRKLLEGLHYVARVIITDTLRSSGEAKREILLGVEHRQHKGWNNRAENSHHPTRLRERENAHIQIRQTGTTLSLCLGPHLSTFSNAKASQECSRVSCSFTGPIPNLTLLPNCQTTRKGRKTWYHRRNPCEAARGGI